MIEYITIIYSKILNEKILKSKTFNIFHLCEAKIKSLDNNIIFNLIWRRKNSLLKNILDSNLTNSLIKEHHTKKIIKKIFIFIYNKFY